MTTVEREGGYQAWPCDMSEKRVLLTPENDLYQETTVNNTNVCMNVHQ